MKKAGAFLVSWFLLFAGASFLCGKSVNHFLLHQCNEAHPIEPIQEKHEFIHEVNYLTWDRQHGADSLELMELNLKVKGAAWVEPDRRGHALQREGGLGRLTEDETGLFQLVDISRDRPGLFHKNEQELRRYNKAFLAQERMVRLDDDEYRHLRTRLWRSPENQDEAGKDKLESHGLYHFSVSQPQGLVRQHQEVVAKLEEEKARLIQEVEKLKRMSRQKAEDLMVDLVHDEESHECDRIADHAHDHQSKDEADEDEFDPKDLPERRAPVLQVRVTLDGKKEAPADSDPIARERRDKVREAMIHAFGSYETYAWGFDELLPISQRGSNQFGGFGATIIDSLDTLFIMGLHEQFEKATEWVSTNLNFNQRYLVSVFETTIKVLGGLLSSYDLSGNVLFLTKAQELADRLSPAWDTPTGIPLFAIELASGRAFNPHWAGGSSLLADAGTEQLEFIALSQRTGIRKYEEMVEKVVWKFKEIYPADGLLPIYISPHTGRPTNQKITFGAMGDSFYEYLLKAWIQGNKTHVVEHHRDMWEQSMEGLLSLVKKSTPSSYVYLAERNGDSIFDKMDELACFAPGMLALGAEQGGASPAKAAQYLETAEGLARTCYNFYMSTRTHLAGEDYHFRDGQDMSVGTSYNILRPETIESFFYLWRKTGDTKYRDWGWDIFQAFETHSRVPTGYVGMRDVNSGETDDTMQSFFLAETLKYLYLLFSPSSVIPLDEWVFNSGGHPVKIKTRSQAGEYNESQNKKEGDRKDYRLSASK